MKMYALTMYGCGRIMPEYLYRCDYCGGESVLVYSVKEDKPSDFKVPHKQRGNSKEECPGTLHRVFDVINLTNVNRFGTRSKRDTGRDRK